jgi:N4-gp56 family major capsid protein
MGLESFIPEIWAPECLRQLEKFLVYAQTGIVNRDYEGTISGMGDTVRIPGIGAVTVKSYSKNTDIDSPETLSDAETKLLIDQGDYFNIFIDSIDKAQQNPKVMASAMQEAGYALRDALDQFVAGLYTDASASNLIGTDASPKTPNNTSGSTENCYNLLVDCSTKLTKSKVPTEGRWIIVPPEYYALLLKDDRFVDASKSGSTDALRNGMVGRAAGFNVLQSHNVPNTTGTKYKLMFGTSMAISLAVQLTDLKPYQPEKRFGDAVKGLQVYGGKVVRPDALGVMTCNFS